ncbi:HAD family hydrolase [Rhodococcus marinonascens]|uniref:HAD family hydrolase n=1 Tax=Rhodococcus marinonascens TaxID=38311 RepID=UPI000B09CB3C|nr:haloacid dehalogenase-like hydrolase [Rhodococcus marinonascens]
MKSLRARSMWMGSLSLSLTLLAAACTSGSGEAAGSRAGEISSCRSLDSTLEWYGDNRQELDQLIARAGECGGGGDVADGAPLALFDWDNTVVKNDVGYATAYWMIKNDKVLQPPDRDWTATNRNMTAQAASALAAACGGEVEPGQPLPTGSDLDCADEILAVLDGETTAGEPAFAGYDHRRNDPSYAWFAQLMGGHSVQDITDFARAARAENLAAPEGAEQTVGTHQVDASVRYYPQMVDLIDTLRANGFDVRIISASTEQVVRVWAQELGFEPDRVMGVRPLVDNGIITRHLVGCGDVPDGDDGVVPYVDGKRCQVNQVVFGVTGADAFAALPSEERQVFAAGDTGTDVTFLSDATGARLVLNRNNPELMCNAYDNSDGKWLINPMFLQPKAQASQPYPCSSTAFVDAAGTKGPVHRVDGSVIEDQVDSVY